MEKGKLRLVEAPPIVEIKDLKKWFGDVRALDGVNLEIPEGKILGLLGPNASGKTTLLKILAGMCMDYQGKVEIDGHRPGAFTKAEVAYFPDKSTMPKDMPVKDMIELYNTFFDDFDEAKCRELLNIFHIGEEQTVKEMSKGVVDKLQISLMMARSARLYLLDEPLGAVDVEAREHVLDIILENFNPKGTMIIVTHLIRDIERLFDGVIVLQDGKITAVEDSDVLRDKYGGTLENAMKHMFRGEDNVEGGIKK